MALSSEEDFTVDGACALRTGSLIMFSHISSRLEQECGKNRSDNNLISELHGMCII